MREVAGFGVGLRTAFVEEVAGIANGERAPDWLEVTPENWVCHGGRRRRHLDACIERYPVVPHSVSLSLGGPDPLDQEFLAAVDALCRRTGAPWWSDHLCYSTLGGAHTHDLLPLPLSEEAAERAAARARQVMARVETPFLVENITFYAHMPGGDMDEPAFLRRVVEEADCGLLLDVNNVWVNARNHGFDERAFIDRLPLERVRQIHVAGHTRRDRVIIDTHIGPIIDEVWALYRHTIARMGARCRRWWSGTRRSLPLGQVLDEVDRARAESAAALAQAGVAA